jgi:hypothetical protein
MARRARWAAGEAVLCNPDLVSHILSGTVGPSTYFAASHVSRAWRAACRAGETLLRLVALYQGGLTKTAFTRLFALTPREADGFPRTSHRRGGGGVYYIYGESAVDSVLAPGGFARWHQRLANRPAASTGRPAADAWEVEDRLHARVARLVHTRFVR